MPPDALEFYERKKGSGLYHARCKVCFRSSVLRDFGKHRDARIARMRLYRIENVEHFRGYDRARYPDRKHTQAEYLAEWKKRNRNLVNAYQTRREAAKNSGVTELIDTDEIYLRDDCRCHICGQHVHRGEATLDHLVPLSRGGDHLRTNVRLAHRSCNSRMGVARLPAQLLLVG